MEISAILIKSRTGHVTTISHNRTLDCCHAGPAGRQHMVEFFSKQSSSDFMPHGHCYFWQPTIVWLHAASDSVIALSYYFILLALIYFVRKR
jgi:hypothetical protein